MKDPTIYILYLLQMIVARFLYETHKEEFGMLPGVCPRGGLAAVRLRTSKHLDLVCVVVYIYIHVYDHSTFKIGEAL